MKVYTIGRSTDSNVYIDDPMVSRRHALLKVYASGKMELVDLSQNGTFVNGVKLKRNTPVPVSRKDIIKIAQVRILDWNLIPNPLAYIKYAALGIAGVIVLMVLIRMAFGIYEKYAPSTDDDLFPKTEQSNGGINNPLPEPGNIKAPKPIAPEESETTGGGEATESVIPVKKDRITMDDVLESQAVSHKKEQDSIAKAKAKARARAKAKAKDKTNDKKGKQKATNDKEKDSKEYVTPIL